MLKDKLKNSAHGQHLAEIEDLKTSIGEILLRSLNDGDDIKSELNN